MNTTPPPNDQSRFGFALPEDEASRDRLAELGQLASGLVHELKNPLGAIDLNIEMLLDQSHKGTLAPDAKTVRRLERLQRSSKHLHSIIKSFLSFARPGKPDKDRINVNELIAAILEEHSDFLDGANVTVHSSPQEDLFAVPGDIGHLRSIFLNIILNARDALLLREEDRKLFIYTRNRSNAVNILIGNNGPALSDNAAAHLFDAFYSDKENGTGLGLAIVRRLVELHNGSVAVHSHPDQGVSFTVEIPTTLGPAKPRASLPIPDADARVVDDPDTDTFVRIIQADIDRH